MVKLQQITTGLIRSDLNFTRRIVFATLSKLRNSIPEAKEYHIFTDRFYTNLIIGTEFLKADYFLIGIIMNNRKGFPEQIKKTNLTIEQKNHLQEERKNVSNGVRKKS